MIKDDGRVLHFSNPKVQASLNANTFAISGPSEDKRKYSICNRVLVTLPPTHTHTAITELLPGIFNQLVSTKVS